MNEQIQLPDRRLQVFVSSTLGELAVERAAVREAIERLRLAPVMFEAGARAHPPRDLYRAYLERADVFVGIYWQSYGWIAPGERLSGLEDEFARAQRMPRLLYVKRPSPDRDSRLAAMIEGVENASYKSFSTPEELRELVENNLAHLLTERFATGGEAAPERGAIPASLTPLVGRERELTAVGELLAGEDVRLVTLTGPGGVGKTRLAIEVASRLAERFDDGARFVGLASLTDPDLVASTIADELGVADLGAGLRDRRLLLVLDNFEQVIDAAPSVTALLAAAPGVKALVTSRRVLRVTGEHGYPVAPIASEAAVRLFADRARAVDPTFALTDANADAVAEIARRLDRLPLAIELAAARVRLLPPRALLAGLGAGIGMLDTGARDAPLRHRALTRTIEWSYDLLTPTEQRLFARLAVFSGGFDLTAAEAVAGDAMSPWEVADALAALVDASLVRTEVRGEGTRLALLQVIREFAAGRLLGSDDRETAGHRHAAHFGALAEAAGPGLPGSHQREWLSRLADDHDNVRAALGWHLDHGEVEAALDIVWGIWMFWWFAGHLDEARRWMERVVQAADGFAEAVRARALVAAGYQRFGERDVEGARVVLEEAVGLYRSTDDRWSTALATGTLGRVASAAGELEHAETLLAESVAGFRELGDDWYATAMVAFLGGVALERGDAAGAAGRLEEALARARDMDDTLLLLLSLYDLAAAREGQGRPGEAASLLAEGVAVATRAGDETSVVELLRALAGLSANAPGRAAELLAAADAMSARAGVGWLDVFASGRPGPARGADRVRTALGAEAFERAWSRGAELGAAEVVALALAGAAE